MFTSEAQLLFYTSRELNGTFLVGLTTTNTLHITSTNDVTNIL
jgi:hypothetical protein